MSKLTLKEESAVIATPAAGYVTFYAKTDGLLYFKDDGGNEYPVKPVGGGTGDFESDGSVPMAGDINLGGFNITAAGVAFLIEQAAADADVPGSGQLWVKNTTPNELWFTDDAGTDVQLGIPGAGDLLADGTIPLTQNWDVGGFTITGTQFISDIATGTAPFVVASTTEVANLKAASVTTNADLTGHVTSTGNATILGSFTKSQLSTAVSDGTPLYSGDVTSNIPVATDAIWDAAGDLAVGTGADTAVRLALGTALQVLRVNAGATAPEWAAAAAGAGVFGLYKSTDYTAVNGDYVFVDTTGAVVEITLPASPADGELVWIGDYGGVALTNNITINRNANLIDSAAANILINVNDQYALLIWDNANSTWRSYQSAYVWGSGGGGLDASVKTGAYTILASEDVGVDSSGGVFDITLKLTPSVGDVAYIRDVGQSCGTNAVGILRNGSTINGAAADESLNVDNGVYLFTYDGTTWKFTPITVGGLNQTQVDARVVAGVSGDQHWWVPASQMWASPNVPATAIAVYQETAYQHASNGWGFAGTGAINEVQFDLVFPKRWDVGVLKVTLYWRTGGTSSNNVLWSFRATTMADGEKANAGFIAPFTDVVDSAIGTLNTLQICSQTANLAFSGSGDAELVGFLIRRNSSDALDTNTDIAYLLGVVVEWTSNAPTDA